MGRRVAGGERLTLAGVDSVGFPSVAQGGRRIAVTDREAPLVNAGTHIGSSTLQDREIYSLQTTADDQLLAGLEVTWSGLEIIGSGGDCYLAWRAVAPLGDVVEQRRVGDGSAPVCRPGWWGGVTQSISNARIVDFSLALGAPTSALPGPPSRGRVQTPH